MAYKEAPLDRLFQLPNLAGITDPTAAIQKLKEKAGSYDHLEHYRGPYKARVLKVERLTNASKNPPVLPGTTQATQNELHGRATRQNMAYMRITYRLEDEATGFLDASLPDPCAKAGVAAKMAAADLHTFAGSFVIVPEVEGVSIPQYWDMITVQFDQFSRKNATLVSHLSVPTVKANTDCTDISAMRALSTGELGRLGDANEGFPEVITMDPDQLLIAQTQKEWTKNRAAQAFIPQWTPGTKGDFHGDSAWGPPPLTAVKRIADKSMPLYVVEVPNSQGGSAFLEPVFGQVWQALVSSAFMSATQGDYVPHGKKQIWHSTLNPTGRVLRPLGGSSGLRTVANAEKKWAKAVREHGAAKAATAVARPVSQGGTGTAHYSGRAIDFYLGPGSGNKKFHNWCKVANKKVYTNAAGKEVRKCPGDHGWSQYPAYKWLKFNGYRFGLKQLPGEFWHWEMHKDAWKWFNNILKEAQGWEHGLPPL